MLNAQCSMKTKRSGVNFPFSISLKLPAAPPLHIVEIRPAGILDFTQEKAGTHLRIVARTVMLPVGNIELVAQIIELVATKIVDPSGSAERTKIGDIGFGQTIEVERMANATHVKSSVVRHQDGTFLQIVAYLVPHLHKVGRVGRVRRANAVHLNVEYTIAVVLGPHQPRPRFHNPSALHHADARLADGGPLRRGGLKIDSNKIDIRHIVFSFYSL